MIKTVNIFVNMLVLNSTIKIEESIIEIIIFCQRSVLVSANFELFKSAGLRSNRKNNGHQDENASD